VLAQAVHGSAQLLAWHDPLGPAPQDPANAFGRVGKNCLEPPIKGFIGKRLRFLVGSNLEQRIDGGLDGALVKKVAAEGVDRTDARKLEFLEGAIEPGALFRPGIDAGRLDFSAEVELCFPGGFLREGDRNDALECANTSADESHDPPYEGGRLSSSGRCLDKKGRAELGRDAAARFAVREFRHGAPRSAISGSIPPRGLSVTRRSSWGPQTTR
jgi:hypothetical protein